MHLLHAYEIESVISQKSVGIITYSHYYYFLYGSFRLREGEGE